MTIEQNEDKNKHPNTQPNGRTRKPRDHDHDHNSSVHDEVDEQTSMNEWTRFVRSSYPPPRRGPKSSGPGAEGSSSSACSSSRSSSLSSSSSSSSSLKERGWGVRRPPGLTPGLKRRLDQVGHKRKAGSGSACQNQLHSGSNSGSHSHSGSHFHLDSESDLESESDLIVNLDIRAWRKAQPKTVRGIRRFYCENGFVPVPTIWTAGSRASSSVGSGSGGSSSGSSSGCEASSSGSRRGSRDRDRDPSGRQSQLERKKKKKTGNNRSNDQADIDQDDRSSIQSATSSIKSTTSDTEMIEQIVLEYALKGPEQRKNIQASVDLAVDFFPGSFGVFRLSVGGADMRGDAGEEGVGEVVSGSEEMVRMWNDVRVGLGGGSSGLGGCRFRYSRRQGREDGKRHRGRSEGRIGDDAEEGDASQDDVHQDEQGEVEVEPGPQRGTFIPDLQSDWRFSQHPFVQKAKIESFISRSIELELDREALPSHDLPSIPSSEKIVRLVVGTLDVYCTTTSGPEGPATMLSPAQDRVLGHITSMLQTQLKATWEGRRRSREARANTAISGFIDDALASHDPTRLVASVQKTKAENRKRQGENYVDLDRLDQEKEATTNGSDPAEPLQEEPGKLEEMARSASARLSGVLGDIDGLCIVDLRSIQPVDRYNPEEYYVDTESPYPTNSLAHFRSSEDVVFPDFRQIKAAQAIAKFLKSSSALPRFSFRQGVTTSGLEDFLPKGTVTHVAMPFFVPDDPLFIIIATSRDPHYYFDQRDTNIIRTMGSVLRAQALQARMVAADAIKTAFLSSISHELRTPMHGVLTGLQLVRDALTRQDWPQLGQVLGVAESSGKTLQHLLNDVLDFGSIGKKGQKRSRLAEVDLAKSADEMAMACSTRMSSDKKDGADVELIVEYEERDWKAMIDEAGYHRILINGLTNAIKFTEKGSITLKLSTNECRTKVIIQIIDTGIGIEAKFAPRLFEPFTKSDSFSSGAGLGLYITKGLVDRMNGTLVLAPNEKGGTTFEVVLPVQMVDPAEGGGKIRSKPVKGFLLNLETENEDQEVTPEGQGQTDAAGQTEPDLSPDSNSTSSPGRQQTKPAVATTKTTPSTAPSEAVRVLVVDDNEISRKLLLMALKRSPTKVMTAQAMDGREAVQKFREFKPDLVLTDVSMPVMDGLTAAGKMRQVEDGRDGELGPRDERRSSETEDGEDSGCGCDQSGDNRYKTRIFAITGLGSSDPRLKNDALRGGASLDGWLVKGEHGLEVIYKIVKETLEKRNDRRASA